MTVVLWFGWQHGSFSNIFKAVPLQMHTRVFSRAGTEMLRSSHDSSILPVTSTVPRALQDELLSICLKVL